MNQYSHDIFFLSQIQYRCNSNGFTEVAQTKLEATMAVGCGKGSSESLFHFSGRSGYLQRRSVPESTAGASNALPMERPAL